jgi:hypothetical protein
MTAPRPQPDLVLPPQVWRGRELAQAQEKTLSTGHALLDAQLPGSGWPLGNLVEILQREAQQHVWQLAGPALAEAMRRTRDPAVLVHPPYQPFGPALREQGIVPEHLLCVQAEPPAARLWATEQALRCADVVAVLAWLPRARAEDLRRLHLCAQGGDKAAAGVPRRRCARPVVPRPRAAAGAGQRSDGGAGPQAQGAAAAASPAAARAAAATVGAAGRPQGAPPAVSLPPSPDRMYWIALLPSRNEDATAWGWRALQFTPRVAVVDEACCWRRAPPSACSAAAGRCCARC